MTSEEIRILCNQVSNAVTQLNNDYKILTNREDKTIEDLINKVNSKLQSLKEIYGDSVKQLCNTILNTEGGVDWVYINYKGIPRTIQYESKLFGLDFGDELVCVLDEYGDFYFAEKNYMNGTLVSDLNKATFLIGTNGKLVYASENYSTLEEIVNTEDSCKDSYIKYFRILLDNMESLLQKSITAISDNLLKSTINRNKNITDLTKE